MPKKQVFLLYNNQSEKDLVIAKNLSVFFSVFHKIELRDTLAGDGEDEIMQDILTSGMLVPLVSADFFTVDKNEDLTAEAVKKGTSVVPILSRDCLWQMSPTIKALEQNILPKGKPLYEYDEKSIDSAFTKVVKKLAEKITGEPLSRKAIIDPFYIYLLIGSIILSAAALFMVYYLFFLSVDSGGFASDADLNGISDRYSILITVALICFIIIGIPVLRLIRPKAISSIFNS